MNDEFIRVAIGLLLGTPSSLSPSHLPMVWMSRGLARDSWSQLLNESRSSFKHTSINDTARNSLTSIRFPSHLELTGICCFDGKLPDGASIVPWNNGCYYVR